MAELVRWPFIPASTVATLEQERRQLFEEPAIMRLSRESYRHQALEASADGQALLCQLPGTSPNNRAVKRRLRHCDYKRLACSHCVGSKGSKEGSKSSPTFSSTTGRPNCTAFSKVRM